MSVSRVMDDIVDPAHAAAAAKLRKYITLYFENRDLMLMGGYTAGQDSELDRAIELWPRIVDLITQSQKEKASLADSRAALINVVGGSL